MRTASPSSMRGTEGGRYDERLVAGGGAWAGRVGGGLAAALDPELAHDGRGNCGHYLRGIDGMARPGYVDSWRHGWIFRAAAVAPLRRNRRRRRETDGRVRHAL